MVYASHILEHVNDFVKTIREIKRICKNNIKVKIKVSFFPSIHAASDPTYKRFFTYFIFEYFTNKSFYDLPKFEIIKKEIHFT